MTSLLCFLSLCLSILVTEAINAYVPVDGKCDELPTVSKFDDRMVATGTWYYPYASFGNWNIKCATGRLIERGKRNFVDLMLFYQSTKRYANYQQNLTYQPDSPGTYTDAFGSIARVVSTDMDQYQYYVQCLENDGKATVVAVFATRVPEMNDAMEAAFQNASAILAEKKLLPKMYKVPQTGCPPVKEVDFEY